MSTSKTPRHRLHAWTAGDDFRFQEINENFAALDRAPHIAVGSYVGTGKCEAANPNILTFDFSPSLVIVLGGSFACLFLRGCTSAQAVSANGEGVTQAVTWGEKTLSWYATDHYVGNEKTRYANVFDYSQLNDEGAAYSYIALG